MPRSDITMPRISSGIDFNKCVNFNQAGSAITWVASTAFNPANTTQFTAAAWVYPLSFTNNSAPRIIDPNNGSGAGFLMLIGAGGALTVQTQHNTTAAVATSAVGTVKIGQWQRCLMTWSDADNIPKMYINGTLITPASSTNKSGTRGAISGTTLYIGNRSGADRAFLGYMDRFCVWNRILTAQEIADDYYKGVVPSSGLILNYEMDEAAATGTCTDSSASAITGTATSVTQGVTSYTTGTRTAV